MTRHIIGVQKSKSAPVNPEEKKDEVLKQPTILINEKSSPETKSETAKVDVKTETEKPKEEKVEPSKVTTTTEKPKEEKIETPKMTPEIKGDEKPADDKPELTTTEEKSSSKEEKDATMTETVAKNLGLSKTDGLYILLNGWISIATSASSPSVSSSAEAKAPIAKDSPHKAPKEYEHIQTKTRICESQKAGFVQINVTHEPENYLSMKPNEKVDTDLTIADSIIRLLVNRCGKASIELLESNSEDRMCALMLVCEAHRLTYTLPEVYSASASVETLKKKMEQIRPLMSASIQEKINVPLDMPSASAKEVSAKAAEPATEMHRHTH